MGNEEKVTLMTTKDNNIDLKHFKNFRRVVATGSFKSPLTYGNATVFLSGGDKMVLVDLNTGEITAEPQLASLNSVDDITKIKPTGSLALTGDITEDYKEPAIVAAVSAIRIMNDISNLCFCDNCCDDLVLEYIMNLNKHIPVSIFDNELVTDEGLKHLSCSTSVSLISVENITNEGLKHLSQCHYVDINNCHGITSEGYKHLTECRSIALYQTQSTDLTMLKCCKDIKIYNGEEVRWELLPPNVETIEICLIEFGSIIINTKKNTLHLSVKSIKQFDLTRSDDYYELVEEISTVILDKETISKYVACERVTLANGSYNGELDGLDHIKMVHFYASDGIEKFNNNVDVLKLTHCKITDEIVTVLANLDIKKLIVNLCCFVEDEKWKVEFFKGSWDVIIINFPVV